MAGGENVRDRELSWPAHPAASECKDYIFPVANSLDF